jgi:hypothetical protein
MTHRITTEEFNKLVELLLDCDIIGRAGSAESLIKQLPDKVQHRRLYPANVSVKGYISSLLEACIAENSVDELVKVMNFFETESIKLRRFTDYLATLHQPLHQPEQMEKKLEREKRSVEVKGNYIEINVDKVESGGMVIGSVEYIHNNK